eukprot:jgi/Chrzof1/10148/Cz04g30200.t1
MAPRAFVLCDITAVFCFALLARNGLGLFATALATGNSAGEHFIPSSKATPAPSATSTLQSAAALQRHALQVTPAAEVPLPYGLQDKPHPKGYVAYRTSAPLIIDGKLDDPSWQAAPWSDEFMDITGPTGPKPWYSTHVKMLWDDSYLYLAADMEDPKLFANQTLHDSIIYHDNDFEVFIDPDGDNWMYYELEFNANNVMWDLLLVRPYRNGGPPIMDWETVESREPTETQPPTGWKPIQRATHVRGNLTCGNTTGWSIEIAVPWSLLAQAACRRTPPAAGDQWRINFSRVHWNVTWNSTLMTYVKDPAEQPGYNWVWSPQYQVAIHQPESWGYVQFDDIVVDGTAVNTCMFVPDVSWPVRAFLMDVYYAQTAHWQVHSSYATDLTALNMSMPHPSNATRVKIQTTDVSFVATAEAPSSSNRTMRFYVNEQGRLTFAWPGVNPYTPADGNSKWQ